MGFLDNMMGNASEIKSSEAEKEVKDLLSDNERVEHAYKLIRDLIIFSNKRLLLVNKQGMTGKKIDYHSIPYKNITHFSVETAGTFDLEAELKIWISGSNQPIQKTLQNN